jgi:hypothetical protein
LRLYESFITPAPLIGLCMLSGAIIGLLIARYLDHHDELEHRKATQETLEELTLTVAHYIRNANSLIGCHSRRIISHNEVTEDVRKKIELIRNASDQIEAVVTSLQALDADTSVEPVGKTRLRMLNIRDMVRARMVQPSVIIQESKVL